MTKLTHDWNFRADVKEILVKTIRLHHSNSGEPKEPSWDSVSAPNVSELITPMFRLSLVQHR